MTRDFDVGEHIIYQNGEKYEIGRITSLRDDGAFVCYHEGEIAVKTPYDHMHKLINAYTIRETTLGGNRFLEEPKTAENGSISCMNAEKMHDRPTNDLISRQAAIDGFYNVKVHEEYCTEYDVGYNDGIDYAISKLSVMPSAQPERKRGKWIKSSNMFKAIICSECGEEAWYRNYNGGVTRSYFCPHCGADMRGDQE